MAMPESALWASLNLLKIIPYIIPNYLYQFLYIELFYQHLCCEKNQSHQNVSKISSLSVSLCTVIYNFSVF